MVDISPPVPPSSESLHAPVSRPTIEVSSLVRRHGSVTAVDRVSFTVERGEFFSILGPSGAGKTSVLRMLAGFEEPDEGDLRIDGHPMLGVPPNRRPVNLVFQSYALFPHLTVFDNVAFGLRMRGVGSADVQQAVRGALDMVRLEGKDARLPSQLSGGEQQRVALARALVNKPAVVLLDEPLAALDQQLRQEMQVELKAIQQRAGLTCVCVTHHQEEAMMMSDRIAVMRRGQMLQVGSPREVYSRPSDLFVARFLGVSNELTGQVERDGQGLWFRPHRSGLPSLSVDGAAQNGAGGRAVLSLRPEAVTMRVTRSGDFDNVLPGRIERMLFAGSTVKCLVRLAPDVLWDLTIGSVEQRGERFEPGNDVFLHWAAKAARVFGA
ncbi:MAG: ABC transporter ATP-binding protein [Nitrospiraceae bacterium]|nr:ABC transporter ATP-binding protein [Nitrospiraceae bacterium]